MSGVLYKHGGKLVQLLCDFHLDTSNLAPIKQGLGRANYLTHMNGLKRMIELKGGWWAVCSNELLSDMLAM